MKRFLFVSVGISLAVLLMWARGGGPPRQSASGGTPAPQHELNISAAADFGQVPLCFIPNKGQLDGHVDFYVQGKDKTLYFTSEGVTFALATPVARTSSTWTPAPPDANRADRSEKSTARENAPRSSIPSSVLQAGDGSGRWVVKLDFVGTNSDVRPVGREEAGAVISYFRGQPENWKSGLPAYREIVYPDLWPGIDLVYRGTVSRLKYEFIVHPGADPSHILLAYRGVEDIRIDPDGLLRVTTPAGAFFDDVPVAYQERDGKRIDIELAYEMKENGAESFRYGFRLGDYDPGRPLILDPALLVYCGFIGGTSTDSGLGITADGSGNIYVTGRTISSQTSFPVTVGPDLTHNGGSYDAFVAKVNAAGTALVYCGYIGGSAEDQGYSVAVDSSGNAYVTGFTYSTETDFPVLVGPDLTYSGTDEAFVAKVNPSGTALVYCGYIGGLSYDGGDGIAVDSAGNAYVTGYTSSPPASFPETVGPDLSFNGYRDAFVAKVNAAGTGLDYCGYIGGIGYDRGNGIRVDSAGNAFVLGYSESTEATFPVAVGPDLTHNGAADVYIAKVGPTGAALVYCGYIGGSAGDYGYDIALDAAGNTYVTGRTSSSEATFPVLGGPDLTYNGGSEDAFLAKINAAGTALVYCGYIGGSLGDASEGIALDASGNAYVTGATYSSESSFPVTGGPDLSFNGGMRDAFVAKVNPSGAKLTYCGYIGGSVEDFAYAVAVDASGSAYVIGGTTSTQATFPVLGGPDLIHNGGTDVFVAKIVDEPIWKPKHAAGDFDGDGTEEVAIDFGTGGAWIWDSGVWSQLSPSNPEGMISANTDGDADAEIIADLGANGLWLWNGGWSQISGVNVDLMASGDVDADGNDEVAGDFGTVGLWLWDGGAWTQLSGVNADDITIANVDGTGGAEMVGDFGPTGLWLWSAGTWTQLSGVDADYVAAGNTDGAGGKDLVGDFGPTGLWIWINNAWTQLSGVDADYIITADVDMSGDDEVFGDFSNTGLWLWDSGAWTILSGVNADFMMAADTNGDGTAGLAVDFGALGLWLSESGAWNQISGVNPENLIAADIDGDQAEEIFADFGSLGLWLWNGGAWTQASANNPD